MPRHAETGYLTPGELSPLRKVPESIERPEYVGKRAPAKYTGGDIWNAEEVELIRAAGKIAADYKAELIQFGLEVDVFDPHADASQVKKEYNIELQQSPSKYDAIILTVAHKEFLQMNINDYKKGSHTIVFDSKAALDRDNVDARL